MRPTDTWTYEGYWNVVLGADRSPEVVIAEFEIDPSDSRGLREWLGEAESVAACEGGIEIPESWSDYHEQALEELAAVEEEA